MCPGHRSPEVKCQSLQSVLHMDFRHRLTLKYQQNLVLYKHHFRTSLRVQHVLRLNYVECEGVVLIFTCMLLLMFTYREKMSTCPCTGLYKPKKIRSFLQPLHFQLGNRKTNLPPIAKCLYKYQGQGSPVTIQGDDRKGERHKRRGEKRRKREERRDRKGMKERQKEGREEGKTKNWDRKTHGRK